MPVTTVPTTESILFFVLILILNFIITYVASRKTKTVRYFYTANRSISPLQNGLALAGDYLSAASFLGIVGLIALNGFDGVIYAVGWLVGWPILVFLIAEPLRNLGRFTFSDVVSYRFNDPMVRIVASFGGILTVLFYSIAQMVAAGTLISLLFGLPYELSEMFIGTVIVAYVLFGGMFATTWVQIIKSLLLLLGITIMTVLILMQFSFDPLLFLEMLIERRGEGLLYPSKVLSNPLDTISLSLALMFGLLGLPHILQRFFTVPDAQSARLSVFYATGVIGYFYIIIPLIGFGASIFLDHEVIASLDKGGNITAPLLAARLGGSALYGFISAVAFFTILAVISGLILAAASSISHDIYTNVIRAGHTNEREQIKALRISTFLFGIFTVILGIFFREQNVAFMVGLAFAISCSANFPALFLAIFWKGFTSKGAISCILTGAISSLILIILSPVVWIDLLGLSSDSAPFPLSNPTLVSMPLAFLSGIVTSLLTKDDYARQKYEEQRIRAYLGIGID